MGLHVNFAKKLEKTNEQILRYFRKVPFRAILGHFGQNPQIWAEPNFSRKIGPYQFSMCIDPNFTQETKN